jgi:maleylacetate reductase
MSAPARERVIRFGAGSLEELSDVCEELAVSRPLLVSSRRTAAAIGALPVVGAFDGVRSHVPVESVHEAVAVVESVDADGLVAVGGGSAIDTAKAVVAELAARGVDPPPSVIAVPTTYAGAEWTPYFGVLMAPGRKGGGSDDRAKPIAAIYDPELTLDLPLDATVGTAMNALAHCAEAYYHPSRSPRAERNADTGATAINHALPIVVSQPGGIYGRTRLLEGAFRAALALEAAGLALGHAMAQALGGRYGLPQGAMNAVCLPAALRFNAEVAPAAIARLGEALGADDPAARVEELARLGGFERLRDFGVPEAELDDVAEAIVARPGARANPRPASAGDVAELLRAIW